MARICHSQHRWIVLLLMVLLVAAIAAVCRQNWMSGISADDVFSSPFDDDDVRSLNQTLRAVTGALERAGVTYFMTSGTLLGSYRHHGLIPWDDDVDFMVNASEKELVWRSLTQLLPEYGLFLSGPLRGPFHWKFYPRFHGRYVPFRSFRWPYVDLLFFLENTTHVWNGSPNLPDEVWPRRFVFPLRRRPFVSDLWLPAPCDTEEVLAINFDVEECRSRIHSHCYDMPIPSASKSVPCSTLTDRHPFVRARQTVNSSVVSGRDRPSVAVSETLVLGNRIVRNRIVLTGC